MTAVQTPLFLLKLTDTGSDTWMRDLHVFDVIASVILFRNATMGGNSIISARYILKKVIEDKPFRSRPGSRGADDWCHKLTLACDTYHLSDRSRLPHELI